VSACDIEPDGDFVWWFDADPTGMGVWRRQPFHGGTPVAALRGVPTGRQQGIAFDDAGRRCVVCVGVGTDTYCFLGPPGGSGRLIATMPGYASLIDMTANGEVVAVARRADAPGAATVIRLTDGQVDALDGAPNRRLWGLEFRPGIHAEPELLVVVEAAGHYTVGTWRPGHGLAPDERLSFDSEITAHWYGTDRQVLVQHDRAGRSRLLLADLDTGHIAVVPTPPGTILDLSCSPDGAIHYVWSRESVPPRLLVTHPAADSPAGGDLAGDSPASSSPAGGDATPDGPGPVGHDDNPGAVPRRGEALVTGPYRDELWTEQPYGRIHSFLAVPPGTGPWPTLFLVHGGPFLHDRDSYDPRVEAFVRAGLAVVRTNYRGSTGYGPRWRLGFGQRVGLAQLEDLAAVRRHVIDLGITRPVATGLCGYSWGGYLVLLAMGVQPDDWTIGMAVSPVADYPAAYRATTAALREVDEELFGGTPDEVPERYRAANPMTYVDSVRGPLFIAAATDDERCPAQAVERYVAALRRRRVPHRILWTSGGHQGTAAGHTATFDAMLRFAATVMRPDADRPPAAPPARTVVPDGRPIAVRVPEGR